MRGKGVKSSPMWRIAWHGVEKRGEGSLRPRGRSGKLTDPGGHSSRARARP